MSFVTTDTGSRTVGAMLKVKGEEYLKKLRAQDLTMHSVSAQALNDMIISGEVEASPTIFRNHALVAAAKGAPVAWVPMEIVPASAGSAGLSAQAPHPHAAVLFIDFLFSPDGQKILENYDYGSAVKEYGFNDGTSRRECRSNSSNGRAIDGKNGSEILAGNNSRFGSSFTKIHITEESVHVSWLSSLGNFHLRRTVCDSPSILCRRR